MSELARAIGELLRGATRRTDEARILSLCGAASDARLDEALAVLNLSRLFGDVDDRWFGPDNREALVSLLTRERVAGLSVAVRARLVAALQKGRTGSRDERAIRDVFVATRGVELTALKELIDEGEDHRDLTQLLFHDVDDPEIREEIIAHIHREAPPRIGRKVLSDIDDTLYANWKDKRFPKKTIYPGVRQLYLELGRRGAAGEARVTFVTARPGDRAGWVERATHASLRERGVVATVLAGSFTKLLSNRQIADKKLDNFVRYARLYPEFSFVFIGDSGQGDATFGRAMREREPDRVEAILIHDVVNSPDRARATWRESGVLLFDTYVGAACEAHDLALIPGDGVRRVVESAWAEIEGIPFASDDDRRARHADLERDRRRFSGAL